ncbi:MAG: 2TM domain-containing protein [Bacteroidetes bacterium]|jgi:hypothetical protein|nr:2TM domain-containing protein [Bacteroidota bacterium]
MNTHEQHELYERARERVRSKKKVYNHLVLFLVGSAFLVVVNKLFKVGEALGDWYKWAVVIWFFLWLLHFINVFITKRFFGNDWERSETDKIIAKHQQKVQQLEKKLIKEQLVTPDDNTSTPAQK